jgi:hypothetical protein
VVEQKDPLFEAYGYESPSNHWLFWEEDARGVLRPRSEFGDLVCTACGKLDELRALQRGPLRRLAFRSKRDVLWSNDDFLVVSARAVRALRGVGVGGVEWVAIEGGEYHAIRPMVLVETNVDLAGFEYHGGICAVCRRPKEACVGPMRRSLARPPDPLLLFASEIWSESVRGRRTRLFVTPTAVAAIRPLGLKGLELAVAH